MRQSVVVAFSKKITEAYSTLFHLIEFVVSRYVINSERGNKTLNTSFDMILGTYLGIANPFGAPELTPFFNGFVFLHIAV